MSLEATLATWELKKSQINSREKFFLLSLARRAGEDHTCWPSIARMVDDTGFDRKTIIDLRQALIDKKLIRYSGRMVGRSGQIPEMQLLYVDRWEQERNSPRSNDKETKPVDNLPKNDLTSTENGTSTSTENGTSTSTENGTLNSKEEKVIRKKSFCNEKKHDFAQSMNQMATEDRHIKEHEERKRAECSMSEDTKQAFHALTQKLKLQSKLNL